MATEIRRIVFTHAESASAIRTFGNKENIKFPDGKLIRARFASGSEYEFHSMKQFRAPVQAAYNVQDSSRAVTLTFFDETTLEQKYFNVTANFLSAALIEYCLANKIMMPKKSEKSLDMTDFNICMDINLENRTPEGGSPADLSLEE